MNNDNKNPRMPQDDGQRRMRQPRRGFNWFSLVYLLLLLGLAYMWSSTGTADPLKREWMDVKDSLLVSGDVDKLVYVRNERKGEIFLRQTALDKYKNLYGGREPKGGPHFYFLVSEKFDAEKELDAYAAWREAKEGTVTAERALPQTEDVSEALEAQMDEIPTEA